MAFTLPALPYAHDALEPHIDTLTMQIHHGKHHQAYVDNLNKAVAGTPNEGKSLEELVKVAGTISPAVRNNGGGHWRSSVQLHAAQWTTGRSGQSNNSYWRSGLTRPGTHQTRLRGSFHGDRGGRGGRGLLGSLLATGLNTPTPLPWSTLRMVMRMLPGVRSTPAIARTVRTKRTAGPPVVLPADLSSPRNSSCQISSRRR